MITNNLVGQNQLQSDPVKEFMNHVEHLDLIKILKFVNNNLTFTYTPNNKSAIDLASQIKNTPKTEITNIQYISALKYLYFYKIANQSCLNGKTLWMAAVSGEPYWAKYFRSSSQVITDKSKCWVPSS